ncbi:hypothetical protein A2U01_0117455, partial [Trifolium medium]|nr:hypothetical protein [Trifolium medium]
SDFDGTVSYVSCRAREVERAARRIIREEVRKAECIAVGCACSFGEGEGW